MSKVIKFMGFNSNALENIPGYRIYEMSSYAKFYYSTLSFELMEEVGLAKKGWCASVYINRYMESTVWGDTAEEVEVKLIHELKRLSWDAKGIWVNDNPDVTVNDLYEKRVNFLGGVFELDENVERIGHKIFRSL